MNIYGMGSQTSCRVQFLIFWTIKIITYQFDMCQLIKNQDQQSQLDLIWVQIVLS